MSELRAPIKSVFENLLLLANTEANPDDLDNAVDLVLAMINTEGQAGDLRSRVKAAREAGGLSIRALADLTGIPFSSIARFEREDGGLSPDNRKSLKDWLAYLDRPGQAGDVGELVAEMASVIEGHLAAMYLDADGKPQHPVFERKYNRDMEIVHRARTALARSGSGWRPKPIEEWPKGEDSVVWAWYCAGPKNATRKEGGFWHPFYIDEDGVVCNAETWEPDPSLKSGHWKITHFILPNDIPSPLPAPPASNSEGS